MRRLNRFAVLAVAVLLLAGACTRQPVPPPTVPLGECDAKPNDCNTGPTKKGGTVVKVISTRVGNWNANSVDGNTLDMTSVLNGVLPNSFVYLPDNTVVTNSELLVSA